MQILYEGDNFFIHFFVTACTRSMHTVHCTLYTVHGPCITKKRTHTVDCVCVFLLVAQRCNDPHIVLLIIKEPLWN